MEKKIDLSVAIVNYNNRQEVRALLDSIDKTTGDVPLLREIILFDNNSSDGSAEMVETDFPDVNLIKSRENIGLSRAVNEIMKIARGDYFLLLDSDTELQPGAVKELLDVLNNGNKPGLVGPRVLNSDHTIQETARRFPTMWSGLFGRRTIVTRLWPNNPLSRHFTCRDHETATTPFEVDYVSAACMLFRRDVIREIGMFDEGFFVYWVDVDWCRRVKERGHRIFCVPAARVIHHERYQPKKKKNPKMIRDFHEGAYLYYKKHNIQSALSIKHLFTVSTLMIRANLLLLMNIFKE